MRAYLFSFSLKSSLSLSLSLKTKSACACTCHCHMHRPSPKHSQSPIALTTNPISSYFKMAIVLSTLKTPLHSQLSSLFFFFFGGGSSFLCHTFFPFIHAALPTYLKPCLSLSLSLSLSRTEPDHFRLT